MRAAGNTFKQALRAGRAQIGLWLGLADAYASELLAGTGFDWLVIDGEHAPNRPAHACWPAAGRRAVPAHAAVRTASGDAALVKQYLDIGAQT